MSKQYYITYNHSGGQKSSLNSFQPNKGDEKINCAATEMRLLMGIKRVNEKNILSTILPSSVGHAQGYFWLTIKLL